MKESRYTELGKIILRQEPQEKYMKFGKLQTACPVYEDQMVFLNEERQKEWDELDDLTKTWVMKHLKETTKHLETRVSIELLCHCINELNARVKELEGRIDA